MGHRNCTKCTKCQMIQSSWLSLHKNYLSSPSPSHSHSLRLSYRNPNPGRVWSTNKAHPGIFLPSPKAPAPSATSDQTFLQTVPECQQESHHAQGAWRSFQGSALQAILVQVRPLGQAPLFTIYQKCSGLGFFSFSLFL